MMKTKIARCLKCNDCLRKVYVKVNKKVYPIGTRCIKCNEMFTDPILISQVPQKSDIQTQRVAFRMTVADTKHLETIQKYLYRVMPDQDWANQSMLIRQAIKIAYDTIV